MEGGGAFFSLSFQWSDRVGLKKKKKPSGRVRLENPYCLQILPDNNESYSLSVLCDVAAPSPEAGAFWGLSTGQLWEEPAQEVWGPAGPLSQP